MARRHCYPGLGFSDSDGGVSIYSATKGGAPSKASQGSNGSWSFIILQLSFLSSILSLSATITKSVRRWNATLHYRGYKFSDINWTILEGASRIALLCTIMFILIQLVGDVINKGLTIVNVDYGIPGPNIIIINNKK